jgi:hypothetical protein
MKKTITLLAFCLIGTLSNAQQAPTIQWQKCLGGMWNDWASSIQPTLDGGYIVAGTTKSNDGDVTGNQGGKDMWVVKISATGTIQWQKSFGGIADDVAYSILPTLDGGYIVAGSTDSYNGDVTGYHLGRDAWVVKLFANGVIEWQKALGGLEVDEASSIQITADGGYIVAGCTGSISGDVTGNNGGEDFWIVKLSATGDLIWQKNLGGTGNDFAYSIQITPDGGYIVAGSINSTDGDVTGNHGNNDAWVVKLSVTGVTLWQKALGGTGYDLAISILPAPDGGYIVAGFTVSTDGDVTGNHGGEDAWIVKLTSAGDLLWQKTFGGSGDDRASSIQITPDGGYIVSGETYSTNGDVTGSHGYSDAWVMKLSTSGALVWQKALGGNFYDYAYCTQLATDAGYIIAGSTESDNGDVIGNHGWSDAWIIKLGPELDTSTFNNQLLTLYPNPTNDLLQLQTPNNTSFNKIIITDSTGKTVLEQMQNTTQVDVEQLASGLYIIKAFSGEEVFENKFIKE